MATGFSRTLEGGHDAVYDYCCTPCTEDKLNAEASCYCKNCSKLFCDACVKFHEKFTKGHEVWGRSEVDKWGKVKPVTPVVMCEVHSDKVEEMYCGDHDLTCCHICINIYHRTCKQVSHVSTVAKGIQKTPEFQSFLTNAASTQTSLRNLLDKRTENIKLLQRARNEITSSLKDIRKSFNIFIDNAEKEAITEMDRLLSILQSRIQSDIDKCSDIEKQIQKFLGNIKNLGNQCEEFAFQSLKKCARKLSTAEEMLSHTEEDYRLRFAPDPSIQQFQATVKTFGKFDIAPKNLHPEYIYTVDKIEQYNVRTKTDTEKCTITGMCQLPDGQKAIVDYNNKKVKLLSSSQYSVIAELDLPPHPHDICTTNGTELVVTVRSVSVNKLIRSELHFISASAGSLTNKKSKQLDYGCTGIACHNDQLYVGSMTALYEYSLSGQKLRKIYEDISCPVITVYRFAVSDDGNRVFVTKPIQDCMLTMDKSGQQISALSDPELERPTGVCVADNGSVFVIGGNSDTVIQVDSQSKKKIVTLAKQSHGVFGPQSLCYDRKLKQLIIGQEYNNKLIMLKLKYWVSYHYQTYHFKGLE